MGPRPRHRGRPGIRAGCHQTFLLALQGPGAGQVRQDGHLGWPRGSRGGGAALGGAVQDGRALSAGSFSGASAGWAWRRFRSTLQPNAAPMKTTPTEAVTASGISNLWPMDVNTMTASA